MSIIGTIRDALTGLTAAVTARTQTPTGYVLRVQSGVHDVIAGLPVQIDYGQHQIHESEAWHYDIYVASLGVGASKNIRLVVPNISVPGDVPVAARMPHFRFAVDAADGIDVFLYEAPTFSANGTQRTPLNLDFNYAGAGAQLQVWEDPTVTATGTQKDRSGVLVSAAGKAGGKTSIDEMILKNNTQYLLRVTSQANPNKALIDMHWYEDLGV